MRLSDSTEDVFADDVEVESLGTRVPVFVAWPGSLTKRPGVLVCPEVWGVTKHIREIVRRFATQGYVACAPEIFSRHSSRAASTRYSERLKTYMATPEEEMVEDAQAALRYLRATEVQVLQTRQRSKMDEPLVSDGIVEEVQFFEFGQSCKAGNRARCSG